MTLERKLRTASYDLLTTPIRNQRELQLWIDKPRDRPELFKDNLKKVFRNSIELSPITTQALSITSSDIRSHDFKVGLSALKGVLEVFKLGKGDISAVIKTGKSVDISYDRSTCVEYATGDLQEYLLRAEYDTGNSILLKDLNRNNILLISGVLYAEDLIIKIQTDFDVHADVEANLKSIVSANVTVEKTGQDTILMKGTGTERIPIGVKVHKLCFNKGKFKDMKLITDHVGPLRRNGIF